MNTAASLTKNTTIMMASQVVTWISSFVLMMFLPRYLGSEEYGRLYLALSVAMIFEILINFGGQYHVTKEVARAREQLAHILLNSIILRVGLWVVSLSAMILFSVLAGYPPLVRDLIVILGIAKLWEGASWVMRWGFQGVERMEYPCIGAMVERFLLMSAGVGALLMGAQSSTIAIIMAASTLVNCGILALSLRRLVPEIPAPRLLTIKRLSRESIPYFLWSAFAIVYYRVDAIMLSIMTPAPVVGWYGASYRFFDVLMFLPSIYTAALFPIASRLWREQSAAHMETTQKSLEFIVIAGIPMTVLVFTFAEHIIEFFFGLGEYAQSVIVLKIFSVGLLLVYVDFVLGASVLAADRQRSWSVVGLLAIPLNIGLNFLFIPHFQSLHGNGGIGAAIATVLTEAYILAAALVVLPDSARQMPRMSVVAKSFVAGTTMSLALSLTPLIASWWMLAACLSLVLYVAVLAVLRPFAQHEVQVARTLFSVHNFRQLFLKQEGETS